MKGIPFSLALQRGLSVYILFEWKNYILMMHKSQWGGEKNYII